MSRTRQDPRRAPRHTGDLWERGHQQRPDRNFKIDFGPFDGVSTYIPVGHESNILANLSEGFVRDQMIFSGITFSTGELTARTRNFPHPKIFRQGSNESLIIPGTNSDNELVFERLRIGLSNTFYNTEIGTTGFRDFVLYGDNVYFAYGSNRIFKWDINAGSDAEIAGSPTGVLFLWILGNTLCAATDAETFWAVDGDPEDWTSFGSGSNPHSKLIGSLKAVALVEDSALLIGTAGAVRMSPSGTVPPFRFSREYGMPGCARSFYCALGAGEKVFFINQSDDFCVYQAGRVRRIGPGPFHLDRSKHALLPLRALNAVALGTYDVETSISRVHIIDITTEQVIGRLSPATDLFYVTDFPGDDARFIQFLHTTDNMNATASGTGSTSPDATSKDYTVGTLFRIDGDDAESPTIETHRVVLPKEVQVYAVELLWRTGGVSNDSLTAPEPTVEILHDDPTASTVLSPSASHRRSRRSSIYYDANVVVRDLAIKITGGSWRTEHALRQIRVYCAVLSDDDVELF